MSDATYDAVIVGGGNKGLILAMYLLKYGGMNVAIFERKHEAGGGWCTDEGAAAGFLADYHASGIGGLHQAAAERDFPEWKELGGKLNEVKIGTGAIFKEDDSCLMTYNRLADPTRERTAESIARFSQKDADTWLKTVPKLYRAFLPAFFEWMYNPPPPPGEADALERLMSDPNSGLDPSWASKSPLEVTKDVFESDAMVSAILRNGMSWGFFPDMPGWGIIPTVLVFLAMTPRTAGIVGGTHNLAHAATKIILSNGGKVFTEHEVDKIIIENGKATGISLAGGAQIGARKMVISTLDPYNLCFKLIGREYLDSEILKKVENLERRYTCITWYTWALHELPNYKAASINPDINEAMNLVIINKDPEYLVEERHVRMQGRMPDELELQVMNYSSVDKLRVPAGKYSVLTEQFVLPANALSESEWLEFKKSHAQDVMKFWQKHTTNMSWDNVIGYMPITPYDICGLVNMAPTGNWAVIDNIPSQLGRLRPIPELAGYKTPIENLYATGAAWHPFGGAGDWQGYNCYKVIAEDCGLEKPWKEHPW